MVSQKLEEYLSSENTRHSVNIQGVNYTYAIFIEYFGNILIKYAVTDFQS